MEVLDFRPKFEFAGINAPIGLSDEPGSPYRPCDLEAREIVGWPRLVGVYPIPSRAALLATSREEVLKLEPWLTRDDFRRFQWLREAATRDPAVPPAVLLLGEPRPVVHVMNGDQPLKTSPFHEDGGWSGSS